MEKAQHKLDFFDSLRIAIGNSTDEAASSCGRETENSQANWPESLSWSC